MERPIPVPEPGGAATDTLLRTALAAARLGGQVLRESLARGDSLTVTEKGRNDFVTGADRDSEQAMISLIRSRHPQHGIRAEESPAAAGSGAEWILDPLDGTTNFIHGYPFFATSVAVRMGAVLMAGAVYDPVRDEMFAAALGQGATMNGIPIHVSGCPRLADALLVTGFPFRSLAILPRFLDSLDRLIRASAGVRRDGSAALDCCYVACGRLDGFWECALSAWDIAAGALIVQEAGGVVTDFEGKEGFLESGDIVASTEILHAPFLDEVRQAFAR
jgi:myo-inositol-1(or 4)-monophosphatase